MSMSRRGFLGILASCVAAALGWKTVRKSKPIPISRPDTGISVRFVQFYDVHSGSMINRMDVLMGYATIRPQFSVQVAA